MNVSEKDIYELVEQQLIIFKEIADAFDIKINHVKPHGALYNMSAKNAAIAKAIAQSIKDFDPTLIVFGLSGSHSLDEARVVGLKTAGEAFADRTYLDNGSLTPRSQTGALIENSSTVIQQVLQIIREKTVTTLSGQSIPIDAETICIHGDGRHAVQFAKDIFETLKQHAIDIKAF
jgi:UPF0271 protein